jgi:hypothetical protein
MYSFEILTGIGAGQAKIEDEKCFSRHSRFLSLAGLPALHNNNRMTTTAPDQKRR